MGQAFAREVSGPTVGSNCILSILERIERFYEPPEDVVGTDDEAGAGAIEEEDEDAGRSVFEPGTPPRVESIEPAFERGSERLESPILSSDSGADERKLRALRSLAANDGTLYLHGLFHVTGSPTGTGRVYPLPVLGPATDTFYQNYVLPRTAFGEFEHPPLSSPSEFRATRYRQRSSHEVVALHWVMPPGGAGGAGEEGPWLHGVVRVLPETDAGRHVHELVVAHGKLLGIASRGWATCEPRPPESMQAGLSEEAGSRIASVIQPDFEQLAFDIVAESAVPGAFLEPVDFACAGVPMLFPVWPRFRDVLQAEVRGRRVSRRERVRVPWVKA